MRIPLFLALLTLSSQTFAADTGGAARLAESCTSCHGAGGRGGGTIPILAGQDEAVIKERLQALAAGDPQSTIMPRIMRAYSADEIAALARHFSQVKK